MVWPHKSGFGIKLVRMGCKNRPYYQIGAMPSRRRTGLLPDEVIGSLDPIPNERNEIVAAVDLSRLSYWMGRGGRLSVGMQTLLGLSKIPNTNYLSKFLLSPFISYYRLVRLDTCSTCCLY